MGTQTIDRGHDSEQMRTFITHLLRDILNITARLLEQQVHATSPYES